MATGPAGRVCCERDSMLRCILADNCAVNELFLRFLEELFCPPLSLILPLISPLFSPFSPLFSSQDPLNEPRRRLARPIICRSVARVIDSETGPCIEYFTAFDSSVNKFSCNHCLSKRKKGENKTKLRVKLRGV